MNRLADRTEQNFVRIDGFLNILIFLNIPISIGNLLISLSLPSSVIAKLTCCYMDERVHILSSQTVIARNVDSLVKSLVEFRTYFRRSLFRDSSKKSVDDSSKDVVGDGEVVRVSEFGGFNKSGKTFRGCGTNTVVEIEFQAGDDQIFEHRGDVREEVAFEFLSIADKHFVCCTLLFENTGLDTDLLTVERDEIPSIFGRVLFFLNFI